MKSDEEIVKSANDLARSFYAIMGYYVAADYQFYEATHPQEMMCWRMAVKAFDEVNGTDVENAMCSLEELDEK